uniref:Pyridoxal 5'-phosphate synthase subunit PdxT n=1 Tax=Candidatus Kentrum eta TaxID=2126337 RepID=A0A450UFC0_9GAMM|nr:MAG: pyridoxal phosphate synthase yaaE subunit [Candidatus Kentron sp. H]VFJ92212.1 MAG: pyridoxal phosphate synthase yaaE subunit [Candidatus Kentron sp. H]VFJ98877.1 MAG: pyridoxal phosphate synthase yaaE subunit [Candidatus Kentron sp. H]
MTRIGILDLQGGVVEHLAHLERLGVPALRVKQAADMDGLAGLIIPGGESSCLGRLLCRYGLDRAIREGFAAGLKLWGTCAGAILVAKQVDDEPGLLGFMDIHIRRNAFGSQLDSFNDSARIPQVADYPLPLTFIRAPKITGLGAGVRALLTLKDYCAAAEDAQTLATVFHPELTADLSFHRYFCRKCGLETRADPEPDWQWDSWTRLTPIP